MKVHFTKRALAQLDAILEDLASKDLSAAQRFEARIAQITERISRYPEGFQEVSQRPGVRRVPLVRYPFLVFYKVFDDEIIVLRIIHGARKEPWENL